MATEGDLESSDGGYHFWESEVELVRKKVVVQDGRRFRYFDGRGVLDLAFFTWMYRWVKETSRRYMDPYMLHPLPLADQILLWQPILSKHISDGIASLEAYETLSEDEKKKAKKPVKHILARAIWWTFWKRITLAFAGIFLAGVGGMTISLLFSNLVDEISTKKFTLGSTIPTAFGVVALEVVKGVLFDHFNHYMQRTAFIIQHSLSTAIFQHGLCYRRGQFGHLSGSPGSCKSIIHSCSGEDKCTDNPLLCPARRYKNNEVTPKMYTFQAVDAYYIPLFFECFTNILLTLINVAYGIFLVYLKHTSNIVPVIINVCLTITLMFIVEMFNMYLFKFLYAVRDHRISKSSEILSSLSLIGKMALDDIGHNIITSARDGELYFVILRLFFSLFNKIIHTFSITFAIYQMMDDFVEKVKSFHGKKLRTASLITGVFILLRIIDYMYLFPQSLKFMTYSIRSFKRVEAFLKTCSPNFYLPDNRFTGDIPLPDGLPDKNKTLPKGLVVMLKKASFAWVNSRKDLLDNTGTTCLRNLDFVLNTGDLAIITGAQGSGKTNFVKAILGDMTLVEGSMAVLPLSTNMPIFYASQDVWLQKGTIRANITFGHRFDEDIYKTVLKAIELEHDISTWEGGDMRKISEHGYSLSGGQRVRVGLARAIYAYLIFSETNRESASDHSFLVVLDDSFTGLDPFVAKTIFKNLFDVNGGLLVKDDVATILAISKRVLDACVSSESPESFLDAVIYSLEGNTLVGDKSLVTCNTKVSGMASTDPTNIADYLSSNTKVLARSNDRRRNLRKHIVQELYKKPVNDDVQYDKAYKFKPYSVYVKAAGIPFIIFIFLIFLTVVLDNTKFAIASRLTDYIKDSMDDILLNNIIPDRDRIISQTDMYLNGIAYVSVGVVIICLIAILFLLASCTRSSRRIHEYCINSLFVNSSSVIKIKRSISDTMTFLSSDIFLIDENLGYTISTTLVLLIETFVYSASLFFFSPYSAPSIILTFSLIVVFVFIIYTKSAKNVQLASLESASQINAVFESAISGSHIHRSFKKEWELMHRLIENSEYDMRCRFVSASSLTWASIASRCIFSLTTLSVFLLPILVSRFSNKKIHFGFYGISTALSVLVTSFFTNFILGTGKLEVLMCSIKRFSNFVPPNTLVKFEKKRDVNEEELVSSSGNIMVDNVSPVDNLRETILKRRRNEYAERRAARCTNLKMLLFKHHVNILDVSKYTTPGQVRVQLKDVNVYITSCKDGIQFPILKNVTCSADTSDIVGIVGRTGAGKSTMLSVLQNLAEHREGSVLLDGCDLNDMPKNVTRQIIGVLPQLPFVFRGWTVRRFIDPRMLFDDTNIEMALENCGLLKFVENLSGGKGLDTIIIPDHYHKGMPRHYKRVYYGPTLRPYDSPSADNVNIDYGSALSNSQLRTLSVARLVLYREFFKVLLVDEPPEDELGAYNTAETPIYELIKTHFQHCTTFIAAHDASVLRLCTSIWVLHNGSLIRTCKVEDIPSSGSLSKIIEDCISEKN
ncbi:ABC transporter, ATP-binding protein domain containing protein [Theileria equi strain WA]|uniref:ABC transporter, ATP-binding protein domain containing protein n=1 Tax=Theileria equi strain WA TaxID=1537102 RepID=L1LC31_THEEQ|nr:ABC transporter, ATP-binding protein domain containing protein [Theileria equi strain WA]EKX73007.1 ABC transporter, ATP-binding protein domain containing protein [Theileria equi strain WA]|eukprot:XP_004832459.1 ABC transporter, ATP-binding protein domain containing protein [Theileria equi strain WA]